MGIKENIEHIDTNIIVRLITQDDPKMVKRAEKLIAKKHKTYIFEDPAMMEVVFVLTGDYYRYTRKEVSESIKAIMHFENICFNRGLIKDSLDLYVSHPKLSFVDYYLAATTNLSNEKPLWTFDHKLASQCTVAKEL